MAIWGVSPELVGRADELAVLDDAVAAAAAGWRAVVLIGGEPGVGKTRLMAAAARANVDTAWVAMGSCLAYADGGLPLAPILSAVESSEHTRQGWVGAAAPGGERAAPGITDLITGGDSGGTQAGGDWTRVYGRLAAAFTQAATERPVMLMIDDLQWADHSTLEFLDYLASRSDRQRLALVATYRDDELGRADLGPWLGEMIRSRGAIDLHLDLLSSNDCQVMVRQLTDRPVDPGFGSEVFRRSGGNPYLIELLARSGAGPGTLPAGLTQALLARWRALPERSSEILTLLAVLGRPVDLRTLSEVTVRAGGAASAVEAAIDDGVVRGIVSELTASEVGFRHPLLAELVVQTLPPGRRRRLHQSVAAAIQGLPDMPDALRATDMALHCAAAGDQQGAFRWSLRSAEYALIRHGFAEAFGHLTEATRRWDGIDGAAEIAGSAKAGVLLRAILAGVLSGETDSLVPLARAALDAVDPESEPVRAGGLRATLFRYLSLTIQHPLVLQAGVDAVELTDGSNGPERAAALSIKALLSGMAGQPDLALRHADEAVQMARDTGNHSVLAWCLFFRGNGRVLFGVPGAQADLTECLAGARRAGAYLEIINTQFWIAVNQSRHGESDDAITTLIDAWRECRESGLDRGLGFQLLCYATRLLRERGRWAEAAEVLTEMRAVRTDGVTLLKLQLEDAQYHARRGSLDQARSILHAAGNVGSLPFSDFAVPDHHLAEVEVGTWDSRPDDVLTHALVGLAAITTQDCGGRLLIAGMRAVADKSVAARDRGDTTAADHHLVDRLGDARRRLRVDPFGADAPKGWEPVAMQATWDAELARMRGDAGQGAKWLLAEKLWHERGFLPDAAYCGIRAGQVMVSEGQTRDAAAPLRRGNDMAVAMGAGPLTDMAVAAATAGRIRLELPTPVEPADGPLPPPLQRLTRREREILTFVAAGRSNSEIGQELFISPTTASVHVSNILRKLSVTDRYAAAALAQRLATKHTEPESTQ